MRLFGSRPLRKRYCHDTSLERDSILEAASYPPKQKWPPVLLLSIVTRPPLATMPTVFARSAGSKAKSEASTWKNTECGGATATGDVPAGIWRSCRCKNCAYSSFETSKLRRRSRRGGSRMSAGLLVCSGTSFSDLKRGRKYYWQVERSMYPTILNKMLDL